METKGSLHLHTGACNMLDASHVLKFELSPKVGEGALLTDMEVNSKELKWLAWDDSVKWKSWEQNWWSGSSLWSASGAKGGKLQLKPQGCTWQLKLLCSRHVFLPRIWGSHFTDRETEAWKGVAVNSKWAEASLWYGQACPAGHTTLASDGEGENSTCGSSWVLWWD